MRTAVYTGTRNLYKDMVTAAKSLLYHHGADKVYFCIEDDVFPEWLPSQIETVNVSAFGNRLFPPGGANSKNYFTYMCLIRVAFSKLFPDLDKILSLDVDTIVEDNIDEIWNTNLGTCFFAGVNEEIQTKYRPYGPKLYNGGVMYFNLDQIRKERVDDQAIRLLNEVAFEWVDEDVWNKIGAYGKIVDLPTRYNESLCTGFTENPAIVHWAGIKDWQTSLKASRREYIRKYREMSWGEVLAKFEEQEPGVAIEKKPKKTAASSRRKKSVTE